MANQELSSLAVVNPVLSRLAVGVASNQDFIACDEFDPTSGQLNKVGAIPTIPVDQETVTWPTFTNELMQDATESDVRSLDADPNEVLLDAISKDTETLDEHMLRGKLDYRREQAAMSIGGLPAVNRLKLRYIQKVKNRILIAREKAAAGIVFGATNYGANTTAGTDFSAAGTRDMLLKTKETIQKATGYAPNRIVMGRKARRALLQNTEVKTMIQYSRGGITTDALLAEYLEVDNILVGTSATQAKAAAGKSGAATSIWKEDSFAMYYAAPAKTAEDASDLNPSFAYCMAMRYLDIGGVMVRILEWVDGIFRRFVYGMTYGMKLTFGGTNGAGWLWTGVVGAS
jgi:hypothetical protein